MFEPVTQVNQTARQPAVIEFRAFSLPMNGRCTEPSAANGIEGGSRGSPTL